MQAVLPEIEAAGAQLVAITPQQPSFNDKMMQDQPLHFDLLSDEGNDYAAELGLRFKLPDDLAQLYDQFGIKLPVVNGDDSWTLPMPARFVVDAGGVVRAADVDPDYTYRPEPQATVDVLKALR